MSMGPQAAMHAAVAVAGVPRDADGPVFREPWEAQAFAMTLALYERGVFTWPEWAAAVPSASHPWRTCRSPRRRHAQRKRGHS